jgi:hypothetical protein
VPLVLIGLQCLLPSLVIQLVVDLSISICFSEYCHCVPWLVGSMVTCLDGYELALKNPKRSL